MKLSIITINYNNLAGLKKTADSVLSQTWRDFEWIIVDGGSTDGSKEYIEGLALYLSNGTAIDGVQWCVDKFSLPGFTAADMNGVFEESTSFASSSIENRPQRFLWCSEPDRGVYNAMNKGIFKSNGEYCLFLNSGDNLRKDSSLADVFCKMHSADVIYGDLSFVSKKESNIFHYPDRITFHYLLSRSLGHPASFIKGILLKNKGYREDFWIVSDWYRFIELYREGRSFFHIDVVVSDFDTSGLSCTNNEVLKKETELLFSELFGDNNRQWIDETIQLHILYELCEKDVFKKLFQFYSHGKKHQEFLSVFAKLINLIDLK